MSGDWRDDAACRGRAGLFFSPDADAPEPPDVQAAREAAAKALCAGCPVRRPCLEEGLAASEAQQAGVRGGLNKQERINLKRRRQRRRRTARKAAAARNLAALAVLAILLTLTGCQSGYPHACDGHGGTRIVLKGIYYCRDASMIGAGWLWLHPHDPRAQS